MIANFNKDSFSCEYQSSSKIQKASGGTKSRRSEISESRQS